MCHLTTTNLFKGMETLSCSCGACITQTPEMDWPMFRELFLLAHTNEKSVQMYQEVLDFLDSPSRNAWLEVEDFKIYVRKSKRFINGVYLDILDLASVDIQPHCQKKGLLKSLLTILEGSFTPLYLENVFHPYLKKHLEKRSQWIPFKHPGELENNSFYYLGAS